ncbi:MAG: tRNA lysidine(34) synthetase TilS [Fimbriimonadaceae bacterium]
MLDRLRHHLALSGLIPGRATVVVAYSGGPDSTCLLHLLKRLDVDVIGAHLHHGQRAEADEEETRCRTFCENLEIPFVSGRADVPLIAKDHKIGLEEAGRTARYSFLRSVAHRLNANLIATGHTKDDHVETVLLHLTRGSGLAGLAGISSSRDGIIRPILPFTRSETRAYCLEQELWTHDDPANFDESFSRVRVRSNVLPELRQINPLVDEAVVRLANLADEDNRLLDGMAAAALEQAERPLNGELRFLSMDCEAAFDRRQLESIPPALYRRALRLAAKSLGAELTYEQSLIVGVGDKGSITAEGENVVLEWDIDSIHVRELATDEPFRYPLTIPGQTESDVFGWVLEARQIDSSIDASQKRATLDVHLDRSKLKGDLYFRSFEAGDRLMPLGFDRERKVADLLSEAKLSQAARKRLPIICDILGPIWIPGVCISERVRPTPHTVSAYALSLRAL